MISEAHINSVRVTVGAPRHPRSDDISPKLRYACGRCDEIHDVEEDAEACCRPEVNEVWECGVCNKVHDTQLDAEECCAGDAEEADRLRCCPQCRRHHSPNSPNIDAIRIASMCTYCSPHLFTREQKLEIEDSYHQRTGQTVNLDEG